MEALRKKRLSSRLTAAALILSIGAVIAALLGALGAGQGLWHFRTGFKFLEYSVYAAAIGLIIALVGLFLSRRVARSAMWLNLLAALIAALFLAFMLNQVRTARSVPPIHDIATDLDDYPRFYRLTVREDNLANVPDMGRREWADLPPRERWRAIHREYYGDVAAINVPWTKEQTVARAVALAEDRGWELVSVDRRLGVIEAVDTSRFFRFKDNVVIRVRPARDGGSRVDMRSISRVGVSDLGVNAERVRRFLADLRETPAPTR